MVKLIQKCKDSIFHLIELDGGEDPNAYISTFFSYFESFPYFQIYCICRTFLSCFLLGYILTKVDSRLPCCVIFKFKCEARAWE